MSTHDYMLNRGLYLLGLAIGMSLVHMGRAQDERSALDFFESKIRPALVEHCLECHASDTEASGGLLLDSRTGWMQGGDSGASIVPGNAQDSRLMRAISYADPELQMPPQGKLPDELVDDFAQWIQQGATDPRAVAPLPKPAETAGLPVERAEEHWAYRPLTDPIPPTPAQAESWPPAAQRISPTGNTIDAFIDDNLHKSGIACTEIAAPAERAVLARRLYFDLTGLPPSAQELSDFVDSRSQQAYENLVDQLLASPRYAETFARHWMDVVRYADSITLRGFVLPQAWRYRDYLIEAFAQDRSFARMIEEQIAGDQLSAADPRERSQQLVATTFWTLGNTNLEQQDKTQLEMDFIDEQLEVMGRAFLGQTIGCARCHDHKFDPIPTKDYYGLAGILRSSVAFKHDNVSKWIEQALPLPAEQAREFEKLQVELENLNKLLSKVKARVSGIASGDKRMIPVEELAGVVVDSDQAQLVGHWASSTFIGPIIGSSYIHDENSGKGKKTATFEPSNLPAGNYRVRFAYTSGQNRTQHLAVRVFSAQGESTVIVNQRQPPTEDGLWVSLGEYRFEENGQAYVLISNADSDGHVIIDAVQFLPLDERTPTPKPETTAGANDDPAALARQVKQLEARKKELESALGARPRYMTIVESNEPRDIPIHIRGDVHNLGELVPRGFLTALKLPPVQLPSQVGGRLELAQWIANPDNPLTARVFANRLWSWLMGQGLVATEDNFGTTGLPPSHPELLDWLARRLIESGWSTKSVVREIVLSDAYRRGLKQASSKLDELDPENHLYWRGHARRLQVESLRDAMLKVSGELDLEVGGSLIDPNLKEDYNYQHGTTRRSLYHPVFRNALPELFDAFDFANTGVCVGRRPRSTVAPQALALMNHPWVMARATRAAERFQQEFAQAPQAELIQALFVACYARRATPAESIACERFLQPDGQRVSEQDCQERLAALIQTLFASLDFRYLD